MQQVGQGATITTNTTLPPSAQQQRMEQRWRQAHQQAGVRDAGQQRVQA